MRQLRERGVYKAPLEYKVIAIATDAETKVEVVIYQELFGMHSWKVEAVKDAAEMFFYHVKDKNYHGQRYRLIKEF